MADLNALIAQGYQSQPLPDPFVQYSKMQQLENSATQNRLAQQQMQESAQLAPLRMREMEARLNASNLTYEQAKGAQDFITGVMQKAKENGSDVSNPMDAAKQMLMHPNPTVQGMGKHLAEAYQLIQGIELQQKFNQGETGVAAPAAAPTAVYMPTSAQGTLGGPTPAMFGALGSGTFDVNAAAPVAAPAAAAPAAPTDKLGKIQARIDYLTQFINVPQAKSQREDLIKQRDELSKPHVVGNVMLNGVGDVIYKGPAKSSIQQRVNANQDTEFVSVDDETKEATPILINGQPLISARKIDRKIMGNLLLDDTGKVIFEGPAGSTIQQVTNGDTISFVSVDNKTRVATPVTQDGKPLTGVSVPAQDLAFRKQKDEFERNNPTLSIQQVNQPDGSAIVVAVNTRNATYQPVVAQGDTFVPAGLAMPISGGMPSAAAPSAAVAPSAAAPSAAVAPLAAPSAASTTAPSAAVVPNALVRGAVNNAFVSNPTGAGQPLISAAKKAPETKSDFERTLDSLNLTEDEKKVWRLARLSHDTHIASPAGERKSQLEQTMDDLNLSDKEKNAYRKRYLDKQTKSGGEGGGGEKFPTGSVTVIDPTDPTGKKVIVVTAKRAITEGLTPFTSVPKEEKVPQAYRDRADKLQNVSDAVNNYATVLKDYKAGDIINPMRRGQFSNAHATALLQAKELFNLGVLNGGDEVILNKVLASPVDFAAATIPIATIRQQAADLQGVINRANQNLAKTYGQTVIPLNSSSPPPKPANFDAADAILNKGRK